MLRTTGPFGARIYILGDFPTDNDIMSNKPFSGSAGDILKNLLKKANISPFECLFSNVSVDANQSEFKFFNRRGSDGVCTEYLQSLKGEVRDDILKYKPNIVIALGGVALLTLTDSFKIDTFRGSVMESTLVKGLKVIPTYHPTTVLADWKKNFTVLYDLKKVFRHSTTPDIVPDKRVFEVNPDLTTFINYANFLVGSPEVTRITYDIETLSPGPHTDWIGFTHSKDYGMAVKIMDGTRPNWSIQDELLLWQTINRILTCGKELVTQNGIYDLSVLWKVQHILPRIHAFDTMIAAHCCWSQVPKSLSFISSICLDIPSWKHTAKVDKGLYNAGDVAATHGCMEFLDKELDILDVRSSFNLEMRSSFPAAMLGLQGMPVDPIRKAKLYKATEAKLSQVSEALKILTKDEPKAVNFASPKQVGKLLYESCGFPPIFKRRKSKTDPKVYSTDVIALKKLVKSTKHPLPALIIEFRKQSTMLKAKLNITPNPDTGCVYTSYNVCGQDIIKTDKGESSQSMGRWSSSKTIIWREAYNAGNLQSIPPYARKMYITSEGKVLIQADLMQAEAQAVAFFSRDERTKHAFREGQDVHRLMASLFYGISPEEVSTEEGSANITGSVMSQRDVGKRGKHSANYGGTYVSFMNQLNVDAKTAKDIHARIKQVTPFLSVYHNQVQNLLKHNMTLRTPQPFNRRRQFLERFGDQMFKSAYAFLPQSTISGICNTGLCSFYEQFGEEYIIRLQLHDAIYVECDATPSAIKLLMERLGGCMRIPVEIHGDIMEVGVDFKIGLNWGDMVSLELKDGVVKVKTSGVFKDFSIAELEKEAYLD